MAILFDASSTGDNSGIDTTLTVSHTTTGSDLVLVACVFLPSGSSVSSILYNGASMGAAIWNSNIVGIDARSTGFLLLNPASGAHNIDITITGGVDPYGMLAMSFTGVNQSTPTRTIPTPVTDEGGVDSTPAITIAASVADDMTYDFVVGYQGTLTPDGGQTQPTPGEDELVSVYHMAISYKIAVGANTVFGWTQGGPSVGNWIHAAVSLIPAVGATQAQIWPSIQQGILNPMIGRRYV